MSASRALRPLFEVGSRLVADQFLPRWRSAAIGIIAPRAGSLASLRAPLRTTTPICWSCRHGYAAKTQQLRFSSSTPKPPPNDDEPILQPPPSSSNDASPKETFFESQTPEKEQQKKDESTVDSRSTPDPDLPSALNSRRSQLDQSLAAFMDRAQNTLFSASQRINDLTGYSSIEKLKNQISTLESDLRAAQSHLTDARSAYKTAVSERASTQREVTTLLARQKTWTPIDFERFTTLYRQDYELEAAVGDRATDLEQAEREAERLGRELGAGILARYHEEQIWSDKIRRMSTWGTWGLMGVNILLFLLLQFGAEPWRRKRLVTGFEEKVREALAEERAAREESERIAAAAIASASASASDSVPVTEADSEELKAVAADIEGRSEATTAPEAITAEPDTVPTATEIEEEPVSPPDVQSPWILAWRDWRAFFTNPTLWRLGFADLISERLVTLRMRDVSLVVLESVVTGAAIAGSLVLFVFRR